MNPVISVGCGLSDEGVGNYDFKILRPTQPMVRAAFEICDQVVRLVADALPHLKVVKARFYHTRYHSKPDESPIDLPGVILLEITVVWSETETEESRGGIEAQLKANDCEFPDNWLLRPGRVMLAELEIFVEAKVEQVLKAIRTAAEARRSVLSNRSRNIGLAIGKIQFR